MSTTTEYTEEFIERAKAFIAAVRSGDSSFVSKAAEADPSLLDIDPPAGPFLNTAAKSGSLETAQVLLDLGLDPNEKSDISGANSLSAAANVGNLAMVKLFHEAGAIMDTSNMSGNPLICSIHAYARKQTRPGCLDVAKYLLDAGIDATVTYKTTRPIPEINALQFAWEMGAHHIAREIAERQSDDEEVITALLEAAAAMSNFNTEEPDDGA